MAVFVFRCSLFIVRCSLFILAMCESPCTKVTRPHDSLSHFSRPLVPLGRDHSARWRQLRRPFARRHGRVYAFGASLLSAGALCAWTFAAASPVLEREHLPFLLRLLWAYCVAVLPLAIMSAADEKAFVPFVGAAQVQLGVLALAAAQAVELPVWTKLSALILLAAASTWAVDGSWSKAHPPKR